MNRLPPEFPPETPPELSSDVPLATPNTPGGPIVRVSELHKSYGPLRVLRGLSLDIRPSQHVAIIGPSGSGKSTLLRLLMTLDKPDSGEIWIDGQPLWQQRRVGQLVPASNAHVRRVRGKVGMVFQHFNLFPHMTVLRNVTEAPIHVLGLSKDEARQRATQLLGTVGLRDKVDAYPGELSGGQKQRVAIARALAMQPMVMLFDEVTSALDPELVGEVQAVLRDLATSTNMTMLIVTHQMRFAQQIADRVVFVDGGVVVEDDQPEVIFNNPHHDRTRRFLQAVLEAT